MPMHLSSLKISECCKWLMLCFLVSTYRHLSLGILCLYYFIPCFQKSAACKSLDENGPPRLISVNTWFPVGGTVLEGLEGITLLGKRHHWEWTLKFQQTAHTPSWLSLCLKVWAFGNCPRCLLACCHAPCHDGHSLKMSAPNSVFPFINCLGYGLIAAIEK